MSNYNFDAHTVRNLDLSAIEIIVLNQDGTENDAFEDCTLLHMFFEGNTRFSPFETLSLIHDLLKNGKISVDTDDGISVIVKATGLIINNSDDWEWDAFPEAA